MHQPAHSKYAMDANLQLLLKLSGAKRIFRENKGNTKTSDALVPRVAKPSAAMVLTIRD